jgi:uncharacterized protein YjbI with pentapeptide repeats
LIGVNLIGVNLIGVNLIGVNLIVATTGFKLELILSEVALKYG